MVEGQPRLEGARGEEEPPLGGDDGPGLSEQQAHPEPRRGPQVNSPSSWLGSDLESGLRLRTPLGGADGARLSEQQAHPEPGGPVVDDSLMLGTQLRRVMQSRGQRGGDFPFVSTDEFVRATSVSVPECVLNAPSGSSVPAPASPLQPFAAVDPEELGERKGLPRRRWKSCAARHLVMSLAFLLMLLPLKGQKY